MSEPTKGLFSAIVPAYNAAGCLSRCLDSILGQTYPSVEVIVVDDGSTDATPDVAKRYGDKVRYVRQDNQGETAARNAGIVLAQGEFVAFLDHDDYWKPGFAAACMLFLNEHPEAQAVSVAGELFSAISGRSLMPPALAQPQPGWSSPFVIERFFDFWADYRHVCAGAVTMRRSLLEAAGGQRSDLVLSGDLEYWAYLATFGKWGFIPEVFLTVDGTQAAKTGSLREKYEKRYRRCPTVESWELRVLPRLKDEDLPGYERVRGYVATWFIFARIFVGDDAEALRMARIYRAHLEGKYGRLWQLGQIAGWLTWKPVCWAVRARTLIQYRDRRPTTGQRAAP